jgi:SEC-C motif
MANIPAYCASCDHFFTGLIGVGPGTNVKVVNVRTICPRCGGFGKVLDGVYEGLEEAVRFLTGPESSAALIKNLLQVLEDARAKRDSPEHVQQAVAAAAPQLVGLLSVLPKTRTELYASIGVIATICSALLTGYATFSKPNGLSHAEVEAIVDKAIAAESKRQAPRPQAAPKLGRNSPCSCASGKKFKKCCLLAAH